MLLSVNLKVLTFETIQVNGEITSLNIVQPCTKAKYGALSDSEKYREGKVKE